MAIAAEDLERLSVRHLPRDAKVGLDVLTEVVPSPTLTDKLRAELQDETGTPEWRAWVHRAAERHLAHT